VHFVQFHASASHLPTLPQIIEKVPGYKQRRARVTNAPPLKPLLGETLARSHLA
jgi:hypothetical protein